jgi:multidrug efflux system membrane fusion protein
MQSEACKCPCIQPGASCFRYVVRLCCLIAMVWMASCSRPDETTIASEPAPVIESPQAVVSGVEVAAIVPQTVDEVIEAVGTVRSTKQSVLSSRVVATVVSVQVTDGERVKVDQVVVRLDDREVRAQLQRAEAGLRGAQDSLQEIEGATRAAQSAIEAAAAQAEVTQATLQRYAMLLERRSVAPQEYDEVVARAKGAAASLARAKEEKTALSAKKGQALARIEQAGAEVTNARIVLGYTTIRSPMDGIVVRRTAEVGNLASPGVPLFTIEAERYRLEVSVQESEIRQIRIGQHVTVSIEALGQTLQGPVDEIVPTVDPLSRTFTVKLSLLPKPGLRSGLYGKARFIVGQRQVLVVPRAAIVTRGQLQGVFVLESDHVARLRLVQTGKTYAHGIEVLSGLQSGERVITVGADKVTDGSRVEGAG